MGEQKTFFISIIMGVILGGVLLAIAKVLAEDLSPQNYQAVLLIIGLLIFAELYLGLIRYHQTLEESYDPFYLYYDIVLGLMYIIFVQLIENSVLEDGQEDLVAPAMILCAIIFIVMAVRNYIPFRRIQDLDTKLDQTRMKKTKLIIPMGFNILGCIFSIFILLAFISGSFLSLDISTWSWIGFVLFLVYAILMNVTEIPALQRG